MKATINTKPPRSAAPPLSREMSKLMAMLARKSGAMDPRLAGDWHEIAGPALARLCRPVRLKKTGRTSALEVAVSNGAAAMQLQFKQAELIERINRVMGKGAVSRLVIRQTGAAGVKGTATRGQTAGPVYSRPAMPPRERPVPGATTPSADLTEALARMRALINARQDR